MDRGSKTKAQSLEVDCLGVARKGHPFWRVPGALFLALLLLPSITVAAQSNAGVAFEAATAQANFPESIVFSLRATIPTGQIVRAEVAYTFTGEPLTRAKTVEFDPSASIDISATVDTQVNYIPPGVDVSYYWTVVDDSGRSTDSPTYNLRYEDTRFAWQVRADEQRRLSLHWYGGSSGFAGTLYDTASKALDRLEQRFGLTLTQPVEIWVYPDDQSFMSALPPNLAEWVGGAAFKRNGIILAELNEQLDGATDAGRVLPHELTHLLVYQATANPYNTPPAWLDEGLALTNQEVSDPFLDEQLQQAIKANTLLPLRTLGGSFAADLESAALSYAEGASAVQFMADRFGADKIAKVLAAFHDGVTYDEALQAGIGLTTDEFDREWHDSLLANAVAKPTGVNVATATIGAQATLPASPTLVTDTTAPTEATVTTVPSDLFWSPNGSNNFSSCIPGLILIFVTLALPALLAGRAWYLRGRRR